MRESGILLHFTSLPGSYGVGTMGAEAFRFVDFLKEAGQRCWQILPLTPTGYGNSPYQSCSTYAGNHYLIDLCQLVDEGLLTKAEADGINWGEDPGTVDFGALYRNRLDVLRLAFGRFEDNEEFRTFCRANGSWLPDFALYMAVKDRTGGTPWYCWEEGLKRREPGTVWKARQELKEEIRFYSFVQFLFFRQWNALHAYANQNGVRIIGDVPIYVPYDSADVWSSPEYFQLDGDLNPTAVAGCPPDAFTQDGQLWGNPLYRWDVLKQEHYGWWIRRLSAAGKLYDVVRLDHFRGFEAYWSVPYGQDTARGGKWVKGPGMDFIGTLKKRLPELPMIAEDLGFLTPEVLELRDQSGFPGMKVLGFAFDSQEPSDYLPYQYPRNSVCYTGTHDNMTMRQWLETASEESVDYAKRYMCLTEEEGLVWGMVRTALSSVSELCIIPMQDLLDLGAQARMNCPGTQNDANWTWRVSGDYPKNDLAKRLYSLTKLYGRLGSAAVPSISKNGEFKDEL